MEKTLDAIKDGFVKKDGYYSYEFGDGYELCLEQLIFNEQWYLALYQNQSLLIPKVVIKIGFKDND